MFQVCDAPPERYRRYNAIKRSAIHTAKDTPAAWPLTRLTTDKQTAHSTAWKIAQAKTTHKAVLVRDVVGELELVKIGALLCPVIAGGRTVGMDVHALGHLRIRLARHLYISHLLVRHNHTD